MRTEIHRFIITLLLAIIPIAFTGSESMEMVVKKLESSEGLDRADVLIELSEMTLNQNTDRSLGFAKEALSIAISLNSKIHEAKSYFRIAESYRIKGDNILSLDYYLKALKTYGYIDDWDGIAKSSNQTGKIYKFLGDYSTALDHHLRALRIYTELEDDAGIAKSMINSGAVYQKIEKSDLALDYFDQAIERSKTKNDLKNIVDAYISKGDLLWYDGAHEQAQFFYEKALNLIESNPNLGFDRSLLMNNLGNVFREKGDYEKAFEFYNEAYKISSEIGDKNSIALIYKNLGIINRLTGNYSPAIDYLQKSREMASQIRLMSVHKESLEELTETYSLTGDYKSALESFKSLMNLDQKLAQEQASNKISLIQFGHHLKDEAQKQTIREIDLSLRVLREKNLRNIIVIITFFSIAIILIMWSRYRMKQRNNIDLRKLNAELEKRVEERTLRLKEENDRRKIAYEMAEQANEAKNKFLSNISHEVRTPVNAIIGFCDLTIKSGIEEQHKLNLQRIKDSSEHLLALIKDILDYSQIDIGKTKLKESPFRIRELIESVANAFFLDATSKSLVINIDIDKSVPEQLSGDKEVIRQIMYNLLGNAVKFTDEGEVKISIRTEEINDNQQDVKLLCSVQDTGIGISKMKQKLIFMDFSQEHSSTNRKYGGAGLGLTLSKHFIELMRGEISVDSEKGKGSNFGFFMILKKAEPAASNENAPEKKDYKKLHILIAEDNLLNSHVITAFLNRLGHTSEIAGNGKEAMEMLGQKEFDAVLMDIEMPEMDGIEATEKIRNSKNGIINPNIPIIALTAHALKDYEEKSLKAGMNHYLTKPVDIEELSRALQSI